MEEKGMNRDAQSSVTQYHSFLDNLKGKTVTIYRGGPESKTGKLLDVSLDYITLYVNNDNQNNDDNKQNNNEKNNDQQKDTDQNNNETVIYYQAHHLKSVSEDSKTNSMQLMDMEDEDEINFVRAQNFIDLMNQFKGEKIQINQGGPESKYGDLLGLSRDYLVLYTEDDGVVFYNVHHVKSMSKYESNDNDENEQQVTTYPSYIDATDFQDVFRHLSHKWVSINRGGPEAMEGVLVESDGGHYTLVSNQEVLRIHPFHIRNISTGAKGHLKQNKNNEDQSNNQMEENGNESSSDDRYDRDSRRSRSGRSHRSTRDSRRSRSSHSHRSTRDSRRSRSGRSHRSTRDSRRSRSSHSHRSTRDSRRSRSGRSHRSTRDSRRSRSSHSHRSTRDSRRSHSSHSHRSTRDSRRSRSRRIHDYSWSHGSPISHEKVLETIDYVWKDK